MGLTYKEVQEFREVKVLLDYSNRQMKAIGYTEHGLRHASVVAFRSEYILTMGNFPPEDAILAGIAGLMHDLGNAITRNSHPETSALIALNVLLRHNMDIEYAIKIAAAIGNHEEPYGQPIDPIAAAVIIADKSDVHKTRVQDEEASATFDIHDRVNYSVIKNDLVVDKEKKTITLYLETDQTIASVMEYFEIFVDRMTLCERASKILGLTFRLNINGVYL